MRVKSLSDLHIGILADQLLNAPVMYLQVEKSGHAILSRNIAIQVKRAVRKRTLRARLDSGIAAKNDE